jgi:hypothetical protein
MLKNLTNSKSNSSNSMSHSQPASSMRCAHTGENTNWERNTIVISVASRSQDVGIKRDMLSLRTSQILYHHRWHFKTGIMKSQGSNLTPPIITLLTLLFLALNYHARIHSIFHWKFFAKSLNSRDWRKIFCSPPRDNHGINSTDISQRLSTPMVLHLNLLFKS